jgi:hypothetical protein
MLVKYKYTQLFPHEYLTISVCFMYTNDMEIFSWIVIIIFFWLAINAGMILRYRISNGKWPSKKVLIWVNIVMIIILILYEILPKSTGNCKVDIIINNKDSNSEIVININNIYYLNGNESIELHDLSPDGEIGIRTQNNAKYVFFSDDTHLFTYKHKIKIFIKDNKISISCFSPLNISRFVEGIEKYDKILEVIMKRKKIEY